MSTAAVDCNIQQHEQGTASRDKTPEKKWKKSRNFGRFQK
jgi:hypothetical protein